MGEVEDLVVTLANRADREHEEDREGDVAHDTDTNVCLPEFLELHERHLKTDGLSVTAHIPTDVTSIGVVRLG